MPDLRTFHHVEEVVVGVGHRQDINEEFHRINLTHRMDDFAQDPHFLQLFLSGEQLFFTGTGTVVVDSREDAFFSTLPPQVQFHVPGTCKLFIETFIHFRAGIDQSRRDNRQASALFHVTCRTEETFRTMQALASTPPLSTLPEAGTTVL